MNFGMLGQGRGSWTVSKNIIMIQLLKSIHIKDNVITAMSFLRTFVKPVCKLNLVSKDLPAYLPAPYALCAFPLT